MISLKINEKNLCEIFEPEKDFSRYSEHEKLQYSLAKKMLPTEIRVTSETYSRDAERTADYELEHLILVNRKAKIVVTWALLEFEYVQNLMQFLGYTYNFKDASGAVQPQEAPEYAMQYTDFVGERTMNTYLGQTIEGTLVEYENVQYWENFSLSFPER